METGTRHLLGSSGYRPVSLEGFARASQEVDGYWANRAKAKSVAYLFRSLDDVTARVQDVRTRLNPIVRAWDKMTEADAKKLPPDVRRAWDAIVVAYEESDRSAHSELYFPAEAYGATRARLEGAIYIPSAEGGGRFYAALGKEQEERPERYARFNRNLFKHATNRGKRTDKDRDAVLRSPRWNDLRQALDDERLARLRLLSDWCGKHWWQRSGLSGEDWDELATSVPRLAGEVDLNCTRLERLEAALPNLDILRATVPMTVGPVRSPGRWDTSSSASGGTLSISASYTRGADTQMAFGEIIDNLNEFMKNQRPQDHIRRVVVPSRIAHRLHVREVAGVDL